jgi:hypothetical protein
VEVHDGSEPGTATFKWSRDNGSVVFAINIEEVVAQLEDPPQKSPLEVHFKATACEVGEAPETETWPQVREINWQNDQPMPLSVFNQGLQVTFSEEMDSLTASPDTFIVTLELAESDPIGGFRGHRPFIVQGDVSVEGQVGYFNPNPWIDPDTLSKWLANEFELFESDQLRCRVVLKGNAILSEEGRPLDGDVFGEVVTEDGVTFTKLILPSGDGNKGGDFESWFYLVSDSDDEPD